MTFASSSRLLLFVLFLLLLLLPWWWSSSVAFFLDVSSSSSSIDDVSDARQKKSTKNARRNPQISFSFSLSLELLLLIIVSFSRLEMMMMTMRWKQRTNERKFKILRSLFLRPHDNKSTTEEDKKNAKFLSPSQSSLSLSSVLRVFVCAIYKITSQNTKRFLG